MTFQNKLKAYGLQSSLETWIFKLRIFYLIDLFICTSPSTFHSKKSAVVRASPSPDLPLMSAGGKIRGRKHTMLNHVW